MIARNRFAARAGIVGCAGIILGMMLSTALRADSAEPVDFRMSDYRARVPATLSGATVVDAETTRQLHEQQDAILVDVLPAPKKPEGMREGDLWMPKARRSLPGSVWLPDVGFGVLSDELESYFAGNLDRLTDGDKDRKLVFYCLADCWMSWNAAKRAVDYGFTSVYWFPGGTNDWEAAGYSTEVATPVPLDQ